MYSYIKGIVTDVKPGYIIIENNNIGYKINTPNPYYFKENNEYKVYTYEYIREDEHSLYGFNNIEEKDLFLKLIEVKGVGPRTALPMLATGSIPGIIDAINRENILYLKKFPKIGEKGAKQIILDLKGKVHSDEEYNNETENDDVVEALKVLGYKSSDIMNVIPKINKNETIENQIKEALKLLLK